jgi:hypothetical protein
MKKLLMLIGLSLVSALSFAYDYPAPIESRYTIQVMDDKFNGQEQFRAMAERQKVYSLIGEIKSGGQGKGLPQQANCYSLIFGKGQLYSKMLKYDISLHNDIVFANDYNHPMESENWYHYYTLYQKMEVKIHNANCP